jgi:hypothetical protein
MKLYLNSLSQAITHSDYLWHFFHRFDRYHFLACRVIDDSGLIFPSFPLYQPPFPAYLMPRDRCLRFCR